MAFLAVKARFQTRCASLDELIEKDNPVRSTEASVDSLVLGKVVDIVSEVTIAINHNNRILGIIESKKLLAILITWKAKYSGSDVSHLKQTILSLYESPEFSTQKIAT